MLKSTTKGTRLTWARAAFVFFELFTVWQYNGHQARQRLLHPQGLLERLCCHQKISKSCESPCSNRQAVAYQTSYLADLSSPTALHSSPKYSTYRHLTRPRSGTSFSATWKQPLRRSRASYLERLCRSCKGFVVDFTSAILWLGHRCCRLNLAASSWETWPKK